MAKHKVVDFVVVEYMPELKRQLEDISYNANLIKQLANSLLRRLREFDCTVPESEQRCSMCLMGRISSEVKLAAEHAESSINSIDKAVRSKEKADAPPKEQPKEPEKKTRAAKIKIIEAPKEEPKPKRQRKPKPADDSRENCIGRKPLEKAPKTKVSEDKPKEDVPKKRAKKPETPPEPEKPKRKYTKRVKTDEC